MPDAPRKKSNRLSGHYRPPDAHGSTMTENEDDEDKDATYASPFEPKLEALFSELFDWPENERNHEVKEALACIHAFKWSQIIRLQEEDIQELTKRDRGNQRVPIGRHNKRQLIVLTQMIRENITDGHADARNIDTYTRDKFVAYEFAYSAARRTQTLDVTASTTAMNPTEQRLNQFRPTKSDAEKQLEAWQRLRPDKNDFEVLRNDGSYEEWKESFVSVVEVQTFSRAIDASFDPSQLSDPCDIDLWNKQQAHMWTILKRVFKNPLGTTCCNDFKSSRDARAAYLTHDKLQRESPARMFFLPCDCI